VDTGFAEFLALLWPADGEEAVPASPLFVRSVDSVEIDFTAAEREQQVSCRAVPGATDRGASLVAAWLVSALVTLRACRGRARSRTR
jgi:hypothetical protein